MAKKTKKKSAFGRKGLPENICVECAAHCCHDLAMFITRPQTKADVEELEWYVRFDTVSIFIKNRRWHLQIKGRCIYLGDNKLCTIYEKRPALCRRHLPPECEHFGQWYDVLLKTPEDLRRYLEKEKRKKKRKIAISR